MPTYVYKCRPHGHVFEVFQSITDSPVAACEECGAEVTRLLFAPAIHFKGSGFHNTDYGTRKRPAGADGEGGGGDGGGPAKEATAGGGAKGAETPAAPKSGDSGGKTIGLDKA